MATVNIPIPKAVTAYPLYDARLLPTKPAYAVTLGGSALAAMKQSPTTNTTSQLAFIANISSLDTIIDRRVLIDVQFVIQFTAQWNSVSPVFSVMANAAMTASIPVLTPGKQFGIAAYPFHSMISSATVGVNNTNTIFNAATCLPFALRLQDSKRGRVAAPTAGKLDTLYDYTVSAGAVAGGACLGQYAPGLNSPYGTYDTVPYTEDPNNGAVSIQWLVPVGCGTVTGGLAGLAAGSIIPSTTAAYGTYLSTTAAPGGVAGVYAAFLNGQPVMVNNTVTAQTGAPAIPYSILVSTTEELQISPWTQGVFAAEYESGLTGVSNTTLTLQMTTPDVAKILVALDAGVTIANVAFAPSAGIPGGSTTPWLNTYLHINTLNAPLSLEVPTTCVVPYHTMTPYSTQQTGSSVPAWGGSLQTIASAVISSQTQVLPQIPDFIAIAVFYPNPPSASYNQRPAYMPIQRVSITFNGQNGLLTNISKFQLWNMSRINGLNMPWVQWRGFTTLSTPFSPTAADVAAFGGEEVGLYNGMLLFPSPTLTGISTTSGGFLLLRTGTDIPLPANLAAGVQGSYSFQADVTVENYTSAIVTAPQMVVVAISSGYLTTDKGAASTNTAPLNTSDVLAAQTGAGASGGDARSHSQISRAWGGSGIGGLAGLSTSMGNAARMSGAGAPTPTSGGEASADYSASAAASGSLYGSGALSAVGSGIAPYGVGNNAYSGGGLALGALAYKGLKHTFGFGAPSSTSDAGAYYSGGGKRRRGYGASGQGAMGQGSRGQGAYGQGAWGQGAMSGGGGGDEDGGDDGTDDLRYLVGGGNSAAPSMADYYYT